MDLVTSKLITPEEGYCKAIDKAGMETVMKRAESTRRSRLRQRLQPGRLPQVRPEAGSGFHRAADPVLSGCTVRKARAIFVRFCWGWDHLSSLAAFRKPVPGTATQMGGGRPSVATN